MSTNIEHWKRIATQVLFEHPRFTILEDTVILPSGKRSQWWRFAGSTEVVAVICVNEKRQVLVSYQYCNAPQRVVAEFAGGMAEPGEDYAVAAQRELVEEVGLYAHQLQEIGAFLLENRRSGALCHVFVATQLEPRAGTPDEDEFIETEWLDIDSVDKGIAEGKFDNSSMLAAWSIFKTTGMVDKN